MNDATLNAFRQIAADMHKAVNGDAPQTWQWNGRWMSQQRYGITEAAAKELAAKHGGTACEMEQPPTVK